LRQLRRVSAHSGDGPWRGSRLHGASRSSHPGTNPSDVHAGMIAPRPAGGSAELSRSGGRVRVQRLSP
jgi:hypothetical protein